MQLLFFPSTSAFSSLSWGSFLAAICVSSFLLPPSNPSRRCAYAASRTLLTSSHGLPVPTPGSLEPEWPGAVNFVPRTSSPPQSLHGSPSESSRSPRWPHRLCTGLGSPCFFGSSSKGVHFTPFRPPTIPSHESFVRSLLALSFLHNRSALHLQHGPVNKHI